MLTPTEEALYAERAQFDGYEELKEHYSQYPYNNLIDEQDKAVDKLFTIAVMITGYALSAFFIGCLVYLWFHPTAIVH